MDVRDAMNPAVITVHTGAALEQVADLMRARGTDLLAVTDDGRFIGLVRATDVLLQLSAPPAAGGSRPTQLMRGMPTHAGAAIREDAPVVDAAHLMASLHVDALAVLDEQGQVVGVIRVGDLAPLLHGPAAAAWETTAFVAGRAVRGVVDASRRVLDRLVHRGDGAPPHAHEGAVP